MTKLFRIIYVSLFIFIAVLCCNICISHADIVNYTDGNSILYLTVRKNYLWAGTNGGLVRWNLKDFTYKKVVTDGRLPHMKVTSIAFDKKGNMWMGTHMGVVRYDMKKWRFYGIKNGLPSSWINHIFVDNKDIPWVSTRSGIGWFNKYYWEKKKDTAVKIEQVYSMTQDNNSNFWYATKGDGIVRFDGKSRKAYKYVNGIPSGFLRSAAVGKDGIVWFGTYRGVISFDGRSWKRYQIKEGLPSLQVNQVFVDSNNRPWAATSKGVCFFDDGRWKAFKVRDGLLDNYATAISEDSEGNIYIGTKKGISRYDGGSFSGLVIKDDLHGYQVTGTAIDRNNRLWFSLGDGGGVESFDGKTWKHYSKKDGLGDIDLNCVSVKDDESVWFGGFSSVSIYRNGKWSILQDENKLLSNVNAIVHDKDGSSWFGTSRGLVHLKDSQWEHFSTEDGLPHQAVFDLLLEKGSLWIGTHKGAVKFSRDWSNKSLPESLKDLHIFDIEKDTEGNVWFATMNGAYRFDGSDWKRFGFFDGLADNRVFSITTTKGEIWFGTLGGLTKYDENGFKSYSKGMGLADDVVRDVTIDQYGKKWVGTALGISCLDDRLEFSNMAYTGLGARASLTIVDSALNKKKNKIEKIQVRVKNLLLKTVSVFPLIETGRNTGVFSLVTPDETFGFISSVSERNDSNSLTVKQGYTNFLKASYVSETGEEVIAKAFWEDVVDKGNLDGNAIVDRYDAAVARKVRKGYLKGYPLYPGVDVNGDGKIGIEEEKYALQVNSGKINPFSEEGQNTKVGKIAVKAFRPQNLPWDVWKISAETGGSIYLDTLSIEISPYALPEDTIIEVYQGERTPSPNGLRLLPVGKGYNLHPVNLYFDKPIKITIQYTKDDLKAWGIKDESSLKLGVWRKNRYQVIPSKANINKKQVEGEIDFFPDFLNRPDRAPFAPMRTSPISNILTHSNPTIRVIPPPETIHYTAIGVGKNGYRLPALTPVWSIEREEGNGTIDQYGNFKAVKDGILYIKAQHGKTSKKMITFIGTCTWCHYFGKR